MIRIETLSLFQGNPQNNDQILTLQIVLHYRHNNFYVPVTPSQRDWRQRKQIRNRQQLSCSTYLKEIGHEITKDKSTNKKNTMR